MRNWSKNSVRHSTERKFWLLAERGFSAAGFDVTVESGGKVDCLDNFSTSTNQNTEHLKGKMNIISSNVENADLNENYDYIFDFSSRASPDEYIHHPIETLTANSIGMMKMLELSGCREYSTRTARE